MHLEAKSIFASRRGIAIIAIAMLCLLLTFGLRGVIPQQTIQIINGVDYLRPITGEAPQNTTGYADNLQNWSVFQSTGASASLVTEPNGLLLNGTFNPSSATERISISKELSVNVSEYPTTTLEFNSSLNVPIGLDVFAIEANGSHVQAGNLNYLAGNGTYLTLQTNLLFGQRLTNSDRALVVFYVNEGPSSAQSIFFFQLKSITFSSYPLTSQSGSYHAVFLEFSRSMPNGNSSWPFDHATLGATINASYGSSFEVYLINGSTVYNEGSYKFSPSIASYQYTFIQRNMLNQQQLESASASLPPSSDGVAIAFVATSGTIYNLTVQYSRFVFLQGSNGYPSLTIAQSEYGYLYAYLMSFLFAIPILGSLFVYQKYRHGKLTRNHVLSAVLLGAITRLALAPVTSHPYDTLVYITSARAWFQYGIANISLGPTLPFTFFLYRIPYSIYALLQLAGFHDVHFMGHAQGMVETVFIKGFPMLSDFGVFYFLRKLTKDNIGTVFGAIYLLNPLSIYVSAVWGQYEAATSVLVLMGLWFLVEERAKIRNFLDSNLFASIAITVSALMELFALIPLGYLIIRSFFAKPYRWVTTLFLVAPLLLFLVYQPEFRLSYLVLLSTAGVISTLGFGRPSIYSLVARFPIIASYHILLLSLFLVTLWFIMLDKKDLGNTFLFTLGAFLCLILFGNQLVQWWELVPPLAFAAAIITKKYAIGFLMSVFGTALSFVGLSFAQGSGYMTVGSSDLFLVPSLEQTNDNLLMFTVTSSIAAALLVYYMIRKPDSGIHAVRNSSIILFAAFILEFAAVRIFGL